MTTDGPHRIDTRPPTPSRRRGGTRATRAVIAVAMTAAIAPASAAERTGSVWLPSWLMDRALPATLTNADAVRVASPFWYDARGCDRIVGAPGAGSRTVIDRLHRRGLRVLPSITATGLTPTAAISCFANPTRRAAHVARIAAIVRSRDYDGVDIDYEHLALTTDPAQARRVRTAFTAFVRDLCTHMHAADAECSITVMPRTSDRMEVWRGKLIPGVYDYAAITSAATTMRVMAYDQHAGGTRPGPMAGLPWVRRIATYTASVAPAASVELGIPTYGRDWVGRTARSISGPQAVALAARHRVTPRFDPVQGEMTFTYTASGRRHVVWYSSPRSVRQRVALAGRTGFAGTAVWAAGLEQPGVWAALR